MPNSALAILTFNRIEALSAMLVGVAEHCSNYPLAIFDDASYIDQTRSYLSGDFVEERPDLAATRYSLGENVSAFIGTRNLGVAGNTNRALKWFMESGADHLCLCNDDLIVQGDFVQLYRKAHADLSNGMFCFSDFTDPTYEFEEFEYLGWKLKLLKRMTGIMISLTRGCVEKVGYFDPLFQKFGQEHCDYTYRAAYAGMISVRGQMQHCMDIQHELLKHQEVESSMRGVARHLADQDAEEVIAERGRYYSTTRVYRPFMLEHPRFAGHSGAGIPLHKMSAYTLV